MKLGKVVIAAVLLMLAVPGVIAQAGKTETASQATAPAPQSLGAVTVNGKSVALRHVYAIRGPAFMDEKKEEIRIILSDVPVTVAELVSDFAIMDRGRAGNVNGVVVRLDMKANADTGELYHSALGRLQMALYGEHEFKPTVFDGQRVAGTLFMPEPRKFEAHTYHYTATFDVAIQRQADLKGQVAAAAAAEAASRVPPTAEEAAAAAASGPGQVASAYLKALLAKDIAAMKKLAVNPQMFADMEGGLGALAMEIAAQTVQDVHVTRVNQTADTAIVEVEGPNLKTPGKIPTVLVKGVWKLADKDAGNAPEAASTSDTSTEKTSTADAAAKEGLGTLTVFDRTVPLRHAYAFREPSFAISGKEDVRIVLSELPITFVERGDGSFVPEEDVPNRVEVTFDPDEKTQRSGVIYHGLHFVDGAYITSEFAPTAFDDQRVAGKLSMYPVTINGVEVHFTASLDAAIQRSSRPRTTTVSGADAAETGPGKVALAIIKAVRAQDFEAVKPHLDEAYRRKFDVLQDKLIQDLFHLREQVTIISVTETGDEAVVVCEESNANNTKFETTLSMVREEGVWKLTQ